MQTIMVKQFNETFAVIKKKFGETFSALFGGGVGILTLSEPDNVLESGIEIEVQPPGKKLQNMMQSMRDHDKWDEGKIGQESKFAKDLMMKYLFQL